MHSTYPWVDVASENYAEFVSKGLLALEAGSGNVALPARCGSADNHESAKCPMVDPFLPAARALVWEKAKAGYFDRGIDMFWLDDTEPNVDTNGLEWGCGAAEHCGALWPNRWIETFTEGLKREGVASPVILTRAGWAGMQTTGAVLWSSDIPSTYQSLQIQLRAGLSAMMSGIAWWTTDVGGFTGADTTAPLWRELIVRWYQFGCFSPIFRTHGDRRKPAMPPLPARGSRWGESGANCTAPGGHVSGGPNELWEFDEPGNNATYVMLKAMIELRAKLQPYIAILAANVSRTGAPPMRPLFYDFPDDVQGWAVDDQYMFGSRYMVAPILSAGARERVVYFPGGEKNEFSHYFTTETYVGGTTATIKAPLETFPLFVRKTDDEADKTATSVVNVNGSKVLSEVSKSFVSFTMDAGMTRSWGTKRTSFWYNTLARNLAKHLAPAYFRYGGTGEDYTKYSFTMPVPDDDRGDITDVMNTTEFDGLVDFAKAAGWDLVYGVDLLDRTKEKDPSKTKWRSAQFETLLEYVKRKYDGNYDAVAGWELGNEPDLKCVGKKDGVGFSCHHPPKNESKPFLQAVSPQQLIADVVAFKKVIHKHLGASAGMVIGPDVAGSLYTYMKPFFDGVPEGTIDVLTYHYGCGSECGAAGVQPPDFHNSSILDRYLKEARDAKLVHGHDHKVQLWVGETSSTYGGGTANASAGFSAGFMWVDKLAIAASLGHRVLCQQVFAQSRYSVLGEDNLPNPDYWSAVLWRKLVGTKVLEVKDGLDMGRTVRSYAFCANQDQGKKGAVTLVVLNTAKAAATLRVDLGGGGGARAQRAVLYMQTSYPGVLTSRDVFLNMKLLQLADEVTGELPNLAGANVAAGGKLTLPPVSYGFVVLPDAAAPACMY